MEKQRDDGDGTFRTLPNGTLEYAISYGYDAYGKRQRKRFYGKNSAECRRKAKDFLKNLGIQKTAVVDYTLGQWLDRWLKSYATPTNLSRFEPILSKSKSPDVS